MTQKNVKKVASTINKHAPHKQIQIKFCVTQQKVKRKKNVLPRLSESELARSTRRGIKSKRKKNCLNYLRTFTTAKSTRIRKYMQFTSQTPI